MDLTIRLLDKGAMVDIKGDDILYGNIKGMYKNGVNGSGCQVSKGINVDEVHKLCDEISRKVYKLDELLVNKTI